MREQAATFSLNQYFQKNSTLIRPPVASSPIFNQQANSAACGTDARFKLTISAQKLGNNEAARTVDYSKPTAAPIPPLSFTLPSQNIGAELSAAPQGGNSKRRIPAGFVHGGIDSSAEVMRLSTLLEDARTKLERAHIKLTASETSVCRSNNALVSERATTNARIAQMAKENTFLKEKAAKLTRGLMNATTDTQAVHDADKFHIQAEGALEIDAENENLRVSLTRREEDLVAAKEHARSLSVSYHALQASYDQLSAELGVALANTEIEKSRKGDSTALATFQKAADARLAAELENLEKASKHAMECAVSTCAQETRALVLAEMEAKLEATEKRNALAEKKLYSQLEKAHKERDDAHALATRNETPARLSEDFVTATAALPSSQTATEPIEKSEAVIRYEALLNSHRVHNKSSKADPHCVRKQMRTAAIARECREMSNAIILGQAAASSRRYATADRDTSLGCCSQSPLSKTGGSMQTKAYPTSTIPFVEDDAGGLASMVYTGAHNSDSSEAPLTQQNRVDALILATKEDLTRSLKYQTHVHNINAGIMVGEIHKDSTGNSTSCSNDMNEESDSDESDNECSVGKDH